MFKSEVILEVRQLDRFILIGTLFPLLVFYSAPARWKNSAVKE